MASRSACRPPTAALPAPSHPPRPPSATGPTLLRPEPIGSCFAFRSPSLAPDPPRLASGPGLPGGREEEGVARCHLGLAGAVGVDLHEGVAEPEGRVLPPDEWQADVGQAFTGGVPARRKLGAAR